eukprot:9125_1
MKKQTADDSTNLSEIKEAEHCTNYSQNGIHYKGIAVVEEGDDVMQYLSKKECCILRGGADVGWTPQYLAQKLPHHSFDVMVSRTSEFRDANIRKMSMFELMTHHSV